MLPEYPKSKKLDIDDLEQISRHLKKHNADICELCLTNLLIWKDFDRPELTLINGNLCILITPPNEDPFFLEPIGDHKTAETIATCLDHSGKISRASEKFINKITAKDYKISCLRNQFDYVYQTKALARLKGKKYDGKRNHIKRFVERFPDYKYIPLEKIDAKKAHRLFEIWFEMKKHSRFFPKLAYQSQKNALKEAFELFDELHFTGGAIELEGEMSGFVLASPLSAKMLDVHFMYGHPALQGNSQVLLWEACNKTFSSFEELNLEQDLGIPGLRRSKLSYYPLRLEKKYEIQPIQK
ncbi:DUF2156 domain-containing protein [Candidatus Margulisiibacteriota bacterium]